jgi:hypothetical protein
MYEHFGLNGDNTKAYLTFVLKFSLTVNNGDNKDQAL